MNNGARSIYSVTILKNRSVAKNTQILTLTKTPLCFIIGVLPIGAGSSDRVGFQNKRSGGSCKVSSWLRRSCTCCVQ